MLGYLIRAYLFSFTIFAGTLYVSAAHIKNADQVIALILIGISALLFPFAKLVYDEMKALLLGNTIIIWSLLWLIPAKIIINFLIFSFAIVIAPLGVLYLHFRSRSQANQ